MSYEKVVDLYSALINQSFSEEDRPALLRGATSVTSKIAEISVVNNFGAKLSHNYVVATAEILDFVRKNFLATPKYAVYVWSLRDVEKVLQGMTLALANPSFQHADLPKLWLHEVSRVFEDKLTNQMHKQFFQARLFMTFCRKTLENLGSIFSNSF